MNQAELNALKEDFSQTLAEFRREVDKQIDEKAKGHTDALQDGLVDRVNDAVGDKFNAIQERIDEQERRVNHLSTSGIGREDEERQAKIDELSRAFGKDFSLEEYNQYRSEFNEYVRTGRLESGGLMATLSVGSDPDGGYRVTPDVSGRMARLIYETSPIRQIASVQVIGTDALEGPNDLDEAATGWVGEQAARTATASPQVGEYRIPVHEQYAMPEATQKFLNDANIDVEGWLSRKISGKLARTENTAFVVGTGSGQPRGFLDYTAGVPSKANWEQIEQVNSGVNGGFAAAPNQGDKLIDLVFKLKDAYHANARFVMNRGTNGEVRKLKDSNGQFLWQPNFEAREGQLLLGYPITRAEDMPALATNSLSIAFGDFREAYQIVDRQGVRLLRDPFTNKPYVRFYSTKRVGGAVINFEAIKIMKFAT